MIQFKCACCGQLLQLADEWAGKVAKCPFSGQYMQVPIPGPVPPPVPMPVKAPAPMPAKAPAPAKAPVSAAAGGGFSSWNPFASGAVEPPPADFGTFSSAVSTDVHQHVRRKSRRAVWQTRGAFLGAAGGLVLGALLGLMLGAVGKAGGQFLVGWLTIALGGAVLGAGVGGIIGPLAMILLPGVKDLSGLGAAIGAKDLSGPGAVMGALYGTARVASFGAVGGLLSGMLSGAYELLKTGDVAVAAMSAILTAILMALGWAAAGAIVGVVFGAALGAVGGYET